MSIHPFLPSFPPLIPMIDAYSRRRRTMIDEVDDARALYSMGYMPK